MPRKKQEAHALAFFNSAREYHEAADELFMSADARQRLQDRNTYNSPLYLLYTSRQSSRLSRRFCGLTIRFGNTTVSANFILTVVIWGSLSVNKINFKSEMSCLY